MEDILVDMEQWVLVNLGSEPTAMLIEDWDKLERKVKSVIHLCLLDSVLLNVSREHSAKKLWEKLGNLY